MAKNNGEIDAEKSKKHIAIVSARISGVVACKHAREHGFNPIVFESSNGIGGVWSNSTIESTKLQTPKDFYQFSDIAWPESVTEDYIESYALQFNILPHIQFNSKVLTIDYYACEDDEGRLWGGTGQTFSP
ncbi:hypothetical protein K7X08_032290 [Anisodus acutangulus]|uniref:Flavin-containing monooxygenase n=1 Tax=Anisodus acutangulus TaxID=402998 RepID=A0A9Q1LMV0_9SOLA|nr:hypothetical protein K7X08_032290 [Anisodus acutangulus]